VKKLLALILFQVFFLAANGEETLVQCLQGIVFVGSWQQVEKEATSECGFVVADRVSILQKSPDFLRELTYEYLDRPLTQKTIVDLKQRVADFYHSKNQPFVVVSIPRQEITNCILQVVVEEARLGCIYSSGNCYFPTSWLSDAMRVNPGEPIDMQTVFEDVAWLNLNPFRRTDAIFKPGAKPNTTDIELVTIDRWPYRVYAGADNTGTIATNRNRLFFGFNFGKSVLKDGQISYQFTYAPNWNLFYAHTASARLPLPWRHIAVLWGGYSSVKPDTGSSIVKNRGISWQVDARYRIPIFINPHIMQTFTIGYDFKETNNTILFDGTSLFKTSADINQFLLGYELGYRTETLSVTWNTEIFGNPGGITYGNKTFFYEQLRPGAKDQYLYIKTAHALAKKTKCGLFSYDILGQLSSTNLLPSEQVTMTGYDAVRGFEEKILNLDNALLVHLTYETPRVSVLRRTRYGAIDELYLVAFLDYGVGRDHWIVEDGESFQSLSSIGPGARYQIDRYCMVRFDYGFQIGHRGFDNPTHSRYNFGLVMSY